MSDFIQVITTTPSRQVAQAIARLLVDGQLAACVQVGGPIASTYRWQGEVEIAEEWVCSAKTERRLYRAVEAAIAGAHPYDTPEIVACPIVLGSEKYLAWLAGELTASPVDSGRVP